MCQLNPCPEKFQCRDIISQRRFDCIKGDLVVPKVVRRNILKYFIIDFILLSCTSSKTN